MDRQHFSVVIDGILPAVAGVVVAMNPLPIAVLPLIVYGLAVWATTSDSIRMRGLWVAVGGRLLGLTIFTAIVAGAALYRPAKTVEQLQQREVHLPARRLTLGALATLRQTFPVPVHFSFADEDQDLVVEFPREQLTLGEILDEIERQTELRRQFRHCGTGYTILRGGDCSFGLDLRETFKVIRS